MVNLTDTFLTELAQKELIHLVWPFLNSPLFLAVLTTCIGGLFAAWLTARWQLRSQIFQLRLSTTERFLRDFAPWVRSLNDSSRGAKADTSGELVQTLTFLRTLFVPNDSEMRAAVDGMISMVMRFESAFRKGPPALLALLEEEDLLREYRQILNVLCRRLGVG